jgi:hypothetical protein
MDLDVVTSNAVMRGRKISPLVEELEVDEDAVLCAERKQKKKKQKNKNKLKRIKYKNEYSLHLD